MNRESVIEFLLHTLLNESLDMSLRVAAAQSLGNSGYSEARGVLHELASSDAEPLTLRVEAMLALGESLRNTTEQ